MAFGATGDLLVGFPGERGEPLSYQRKLDLDLDAATARVRYNGDGVRVQREVFVSADAQVMGCHCG